MSFLARPSLQIRGASVTPSRDLSGHTSRLRSLYLSGALSSLSLYGPSINYCLSAHLGYQFPDIVTAAIMYFLSITALLAGYSQMKAKVSWTSGVVLVVFSLVGISILWIVNYIIAYYSFFDFSQYDYKRPAFALYGVVIFGIIGIMASRDLVSFLRGFFNVSAVCSIILALLYLSLYDSSAEMARIGGDAGLIIGILLGQGALSILGMAWFGWIKLNVALFVFPIVVFALFMSGTRSSLVAVALNLVLFLVIQAVRFGAGRVIRYSWIVMVIVAIIYSVVDHLPAETLARVTNFNLEGSEDRWALLASSWRIFSEFPFGKAAGYVGLFPAEIEYSHNATVQIVLESGVFSIPFIFLLLFGAVRAFFLGDKFRRHLLNGFLFYSIGVYLVSLSAGDAFNPQYWMVTSLLATYGLCFHRRRKIQGASAVVADSA